MIIGMCLYLKVGATHTQGRGRGERIFHPLVHFPIAKTVPEHAKSKSPEPAFPQTWQGLRCTGHDLPRILQGVN